MSVLGSIILIALTFWWGFSNGAESVQHKWDKSKMEYNQLLLDKQLSYAKALNNLTQQIDNSRKTLKDKETEYAKNISDITLHYADSLRDSEERADLYRRLSQDSGDSCRGLADHAAELDRVIVRGQHLVRRLAESLKLRNSHVKFMGDIIIYEQTLINGEQNGTR